MVKPNQDKVLDVHGIEDRPLFTGEVHLAELGFPLLESYPLRQTRATRYNDAHLQEDHKLLGHLMRQFLPWNGVRNLSRIPGLDLMR